MWRYNRKEGILLIAWA